MHIHCCLIYKYYINFDTEQKKIFVTKKEFDVSYTFFYVIIFIFHFLYAWATSDILWSHP